MKIHFKPRDVSHAIAYYLKGLRRKTQEDAKDRRLWTVEYRLWTADCRLPTAYRVPKGFRAPGLGPKNKTQGSRFPRRNISGFRALSLYFRVLLGQNQHFYPDVKQRKASGCRFHDKHFGAPGLQRPPFGTLNNGEKHIGEIKFQTVLAEIFKKIQINK